MDYLYMPEINKKKKKLFKTTLRAKHHAPDKALSIRNLAKMLLNIRPGLEFIKYRGTLSHKFIHLLEMQSLVIWSF